MSEVGQTIRVGEGAVSDTDDGVRFGGFAAGPATETGRAWVRLSVGDERTKSINVDLHEGETVQIAGQTWRLETVNDGGPRWYVDLTRVA